MPRYDYMCEKHGHVFEVTQGFNDEPVAFCPEDGSRAQRQISIPHVIYKGSGFYTTDYKNSNGSSSGNGSKSSSNGSDSPSSSSSSSTESKSETKSSGTGNSSKSD